MKYLFIEHVNLLYVRRLYLHVFLLFFISSLWCLDKAWRWAPPLNTQCFQNLAASGERSVLTLGSLCLPCCVRDTGCSWFIDWTRKLCFVIGNNIFKCICLLFLGFMLCLSFIVLYLINSCKSIRFFTGESIILDDVDVEWHDLALSI